MKIVFSSNISWSIYNFRLSLLKSLQADGHEIYVVAVKDDYSERLQLAGFHFHEISLNNNAINPIDDLQLIYNYIKLYRQIKPDVICHNAIKPNIYGTIAAGYLKIPVINNVSGLGTLFIKRNLTTRIAKLLYKFSQKTATKVFFQNNDDLNLFLKHKLVTHKQCLLIPGSGVNTDRFNPEIRIAINKSFQFLFIGRLLYDKGIYEYIEAIKILKERYHEIIFSVLGPLYINNSTSVKQETLDEWIQMGLINYLGSTDKVEDYMKSADCIVLPSYREGLSKVLIEASSMGLPIVTTDVPGCRDVVINNETGFLCEVRNSQDLAEKMEMMFLLSEQNLVNMGRKARKRAVEIFDEKIIIEHYKNAINSVFGD